MPVLVVGWRAESPLEEFGGILKSEDTVVILNIVISKQDEEGIQLLLICQIEGNPFKSSWQINLLLPDILYLALLNWPILLRNVVTGEMMDWLVIPELVLPGKLHPVDEALPLEIIQTFIGLQLILAILNQLHSLHVIHLLLGWGLVRVFHRSPRGLV